MVAAGACGEVLLADTEDVELETEVRSKRADLGLVVEGERITADFEFELPFLPLGLFLSHLYLSTAARISVS